MMRAVRVKESFRPNPTMILVCPVMKNKARGSFEETAHEFLLAGFYAPSASVKRTETLWQHSGICFVCFFV